MPNQETDNRKPLVLVTGAAGAVGSALAEALADDYRVVGFDLEGETAPCELVACDLTSDASVELALRKLRERHGKRIASVVHLAAYFDFSGERSPLYERINQAGTRRLLRALQDFEVEQFVYSGTMLVHAPCELGERIDEDTPIAPKWAYPESKAATERIIREEHGDIPIVLLHLAGLYDARTAIPTLSHQIARIYERDFKSRMYAGDPRVGQAVIHQDDMVDAFRRTIDRRGELPQQATILLGEPDPMSYQALQDALGELIHGAEAWKTLQVPKPLAKAGAWLEAKAEPVVPDAIDQGEKPFIRPFMIEMADDHYALDISRAKQLLGWEPEHRLKDDLPVLVQALKDDPLGWYRANGITPPPWLEAADAATDDAEGLRAEHEAAYRQAHRDHLWAPFLTIGAGSWLLFSPPLLGYEGTWLALSDIVCGALAMAFGTLALSWRLGFARWVNATIGFWLLWAPLVFHTPNAAAYLNDTVLGMLVIGFAIAARPPPGLSPVAARTGPDIPPGWDYSPSGWKQRIPIIALAFIGLHISRWLTAYQLGHIDGVWEPFFAGGPDPKNGTEEIITSWVSEAWPVPDAGVGAIVYALEILTGIIGSDKRWRTMPWLVTTFGFLIVPLGVVSLTFIIIQPILLGTWCTLCLIAAAAMLLQIPYAVEELIATGQFLRRRHRAGKNVLRVFFVGDTDDDNPRRHDDDFAKSPRTVLGEMLRSGVSLPWNLALCLLIGLWLMFTRLSLGSAGGMADADHLVGALVVTATVIALAESVRFLRLLNIPLGVALLATPFVFDAGLAATLASLLCGLGLILLSLPRGHIQSRYGTWDKLIV